MVALTRGQPTVLDVQKSQLLAQLLRRGQQPAPRSQGETGVRALTQIVEALTRKSALDKLKQEQTGRDTARGETLQRAFQPNLSGIDGSESEDASTPKSANEIAQVLFGNPDTTAFGANFLTQDIGRRNTQADRLAVQQGAQDFQSNENKINRAFGLEKQGNQFAQQDSLLGARQGFAGEQNALARALTEGQGALNRGAAAGRQATQIGASTDAQARLFGNQGLLQGGRIDATAAAQKNQQDFIAEQNRLKQENALRVAAVRKPLVSIDNAGETAFSKARGKALSDRVKKISNRGAQAQDTIIFNQQIRQALPGFETGAGGDVRVFLGKIAELAGFDQSENPLFNPTSGEIIKASANKLGLQITDRLKGSLNTGELQFAKEANPQLVTTREGNRILLKIGDAVANRDIRIAEFTDEFLSTHNTPNPRGGPSLFKEINKIMRENPIFTDELKEQIRRAGGGSADPESGDPKNLTTDELLDRVLKGVRR